MSSLKEKVSLFKDDIQGVMLIPILLFICAYSDELAECIGNILKLIIG